MNDEDEIPIAENSEKGPTMPDAEESEIVIGLVAAVGTPLDFVEQAISEEFQRYQYSPRTLRLSEYSSSFQIEGSSPETGEFGRIDAAMSRGNTARNVTDRNDILALAAIADIQNERGEEPGPLPKRAFVLRQLKRPEEVFLLRETYGEGFFLLGTFCPREERRKNLKKSGISDKETEGLIRRDEHEDELGGQALRDTFHLADLFLEIDDDLEKARQSLQRIVDLLFGVGIITPTKSETGMFHAHAASMRSAQLGRQVGATLLAKEGDVISVGTNEVPRPKGGLYWAGDTPDERDHERGSDSSDEAKKEILREVLQIFDNNWESVTEEDQDKILEEKSLALRKTTIMSLTEFGRAVHAEAEAIMSAARRGIATKDADLYCTTFPCHNCAKHIVAAGIDSVTYIEPYPKSRALDLHDDSISLEYKEESKVVFRPFVGVAPRAFERLFSMKNWDGSPIRRKNEAGGPLLEEQHPRFQMPYYSALQRESLAAKNLTDLTSKKERS